MNRRRTRAYIGAKTKLYYGRIRRAAVGLDHDH